MINITKEERSILAILTGHVNQVNTELQASIAARANYIKLLEDKYSAEFDVKTGQFKPKGKETK